MFYHQTVSLYWHLQNTAMDSVALNYNISNSIDVQYTPLIIFNLYTLPTIVTPLFNIIIMILDSRNGLQQYNRVI